MGNLTPNPIIKVKNKKEDSVLESDIKNKSENRKVFVVKNKYWKLKIKQSAPNCVQKNIKNAASTDLRVFAYKYNSTNEGISNIS